MTEHEPKLFKSKKGTLHYVAVIMIIPEYGFGQRLDDVTSCITQVVARRVTNTLDAFDEHFTPFCMEEECFYKTYKQVKN